MKRRFTALLTGALLMSALIPAAYAQETPPVAVCPEPPVLTQLVSARPDIGEIKEANIVKGVVKELKDGQILITNDTNKTDPITLNVGEAQYIDMLTGLYADKSKIQVGDSITAYCNPVSIMIYPPQHGVQTILFNEGKTGSAKLRMVTDLEIMYKKIDGSLPSVNFTSADGNYVAQFYESTMITTPDGGKLGFRDIGAGMDVLIWCDSVAEKKPAALTVTKAVVYNAEEAKCANPETAYVPYELMADEQAGLIVLYENRGQDDPKHLIPRSVYKEGQVMGKVYAQGEFGAVNMDWGRFSDTHGKWMDSAAMYMSARGVMNGTTNPVLTNGEMTATFAPQRAVTQGQFLDALLRALDIAQTEDNRKAMAALAEGITYTPGAPLSRQDMFHLAQVAGKRYGIHSKLLGARQVDFKDIDLVAGYASNSIYALATNGLVKGSDGYIRPTQTATRAEAAQFLTNLLQWELA